MHTFPTEDMKVPVVSPDSLRVSIHILARHLNCFTALRCLSTGCHKVKLESADGNTQADHVEGYCVCSLEES